MSHPFDHRRPTELEDRAYTEAVRHFAEPLKQFPASRDVVARRSGTLPKSCWRPTWLPTNRPPATSRPTTAQHDTRPLI